MTTKNSYTTKKGFEIVFNEWFYEIRFLGESFTFGLFFAIQTNLEFHVFDAEKSHSLGLAIFSDDDDVESFLSFVQNEKKEQFFLRPLF